MPAPSRHVENNRVPNRRLGRRPHDPDRPTLRLSRLLSGVIPPHPTSADHLANVPAWGMLGNDQWGDCGPAMVMHDRMLITKYLSTTGEIAQLDDTLDLYRRSGNPRFPADDNGVVLADMLSEVHKVGVGKPDAQGRRKMAVAYAQVNVADLDEVHAAVAIFGSLHLGVDLHVAQQGQTDHGGPWDLVTGTPDWGGHAVLAGRYTSETTAGRPDLSVVTWGTVMGTTDAFWRAQVQEAWVVIWPEHFGTAAFLNGVDQAALAADYADLTGAVLPVTPPAPVPGPPAPGPAPVPTLNQLAANASLATLARPYVKASHVGSNAKMAAELSRWLKAWNL